MIWIAIVELSGLAGCAAFGPKKIEAFDIPGLRAIDRTTLCRDYYSLRKQGQLSPQAQKQLEDIIVEKGVPEWEIELARQGKIRIGMSQDGMYASWGVPNDANRSVGSWGVNIQHVYGSYSSARRAYVYTENGVITSFQD